MSNTQLPSYLVNEFNTFKNTKMKIFVKLLIVRYHFMVITLLKPDLVCTLFNK